MPDYSKGCIYMIKKQDDYNNDNIYIGSCCNFVRRKCEHKTTCNNPNHKYHNFKVYQYIRENGGWDTWVMVKIIDYPCNSKSELNTMERRYIDEYKSKLNCSIPTRTYKEYRIDNKDKIKQYRIDNKDKMKQYRINNKDKIAQQNKEHYEANKEKILQYLNEYRQDNKDKIVENKKKYYQNNKDKIAEKLKENVNCDKCGCEVRKNCLSRHKRTLKCINFVTK